MSEEKKLGLSELLDQKEKDEKDLAKELMEEVKKESSLNEEELQKDVKEYNEIMEGKREPHVKSHAVYTPKKEEEGESNKKEIKLLNPDDIIAPKKKETLRDLKEQQMDDEMNNLQYHIDRKKKEFNEVLTEVKAQKKQEVLEKEVEKLSEELSQENNTTEEEDSILKDDVSLDNNSESIDDLVNALMNDNDITEPNITTTSDDRTPEERKQAEKEFGTNIIRETKPIKNKLDLSTFTVTTKTIGFNNILARKDNNTRKSASWGLYNSDVCIEAEELTGSELESICFSDEDEITIPMQKNIFNLFFKHTKNKDKNTTLESWLKTISFMDMENLYFAFFKASFMNANYVPLACSKCKKNFVENIPVDKMIKYKDDKVKERMTNIMNRIETIDKYYNIALEQISDEYVVAIKNPSIFNMIFETAALSDKIKETFSTLLGIIAYIDNIYYIDPQNKMLIPVDVNPDSTNLNKTVANKFVIYAKIIQSLTSDEFSVLSALVDRFAAKSYEISEDHVKFQIPEVKCPQCGNIIKAEERSAQQLLFIRHRLSRLGILLNE